MKKFVFTLETLQNTKLIQEKEIRKELAEIESRLNAQTRLLEGADDEIAAAVRTWQTQMVTGMNAASLQQFNSTFLQLREQQKAIINVICRIDQEKTACQDRLVSLMTDLKGLDKLRDQQFEEYKTDLAKEMENEIGEFVSFHRKQALVNS